MTARRKRWPRGYVGPVDFRTPRDHSAASAWPRSDAEAGEPAVQRAARQAEDAGGFADVAALGGEGALDEVALDLLDRHVLEPRRRLAARAEQEIGGGDVVAGGEQAGALDDVLELADVAGPGV